MGAFRTKEIYHGLNGASFGGYFNDDMEWVSSQVKNKLIQTRLYGIKDGSSLTTMTKGFYRANDARESYTVLWVGAFRPRVSGEYVFELTSDSASYLWIGEGALDLYAAKEIIDPRPETAAVHNGGRHALQSKQSPRLSMEGDLFYPMMIVYGQREGGANISVAYSIPANNVIDNKNFQGLWFAGPMPF